MSTRAHTFLTLWLLSLIIGASAGVIGIGVVSLLHTIQHGAYAYHATLHNMSFLEGVSHSSSIRRVLVLMVCGLIAGFGWWLLQRYAKPLVSISQTLKTNQKMPYLTTIVHALLQIITIALGSPLGREVAPRELSAIFATWLATTLKLTIHDARILLACAAGAGLAGVYNVPIAGAVFTLEVLLHTRQLRIVVLALSSSFIAVAISWIGLSNAVLYPCPSLTINAWLFLFAIVCGPIFGLTGTWFKHLMAHAHRFTPKTWKRVVLCFINFTSIGLLAITFPALLGNGKSLIYTQLYHTPNLSLSLSLFI